MAKLVEKPVLHFDSSDYSPRYCAKEGGNPAKYEVHAVVGGWVVKEHIYNQDVVQMKTLGQKKFHSGVFSSNF